LCCRSPSPNNFSVSYENDNEIQVAQKGGLFFVQRAQVLGRWAGQRLTKV